MFKAAVITVSDRASEGEYEDISGRTICEMLKQSYPDIELKSKVVPDAKEILIQAFKEHSDCDWIITTGGTGISPRDITPEATEEFCDTPLPGISETLRAESYKETVNAMLSRGYAGLKGNKVIVNFPGSVKAVTLCTKIIIPIMKHAMDMIKGKGHEKTDKKET